MNNYSNKKILVIGSYNHPLANRCEGWYSIDSPSLYLGDYHLLIINLRSLYESELNEEMGKKLEKMRKQINEILWANTEIICITASTINKGGFIVNHNSTHFPSISNYHWCPIYLNFMTHSGESFEEKPRGGYFDFIKKWTHFLENWSTKLYLPQKREKSFPYLEPLLTNLAQKLLSFRVNFIEFNLDDYENKINKEISPHSITFLPPPTETLIEEAINYLLREARGIEEVKISELPKWTKNIQVFGENIIRKEIKEKEELKKKCEKKLEENISELSGLTKFKRLLTLDGKELENIVEESFRLLGIDIRLGPKGKEDRIIIDPDTDSELPIEITGVKYSIPESKLNQLIGRLADEERIKKIKCKCKGILIGNHYKDIPLSSNLQERKAPFEPDVIKKAEISRICLLSTLELLKAINAKLQNKNIRVFIKEMFNKSGEILFEENYKI